MTAISYNYKVSHRCSSHLNWSGMLLLSVHLKRDMEFISNLVKKCGHIEEVIRILKIESRISNLDISHFSHFYLEVNIENKHITLTSEFKILTEEALKRERFEPYIKYDIDDIRSGTIEPIECRLLMECNNAEEQSALIQHYLKRAHRRFAKWGTKPKFLYLYHTYGEDPEKFVINYD